MEVDKICYVRINRMSVIEVKNLTKFYQVFEKEPGFLGALKSVVHRRYNQVRAVDDISFKIAEGELIGFIGPNGAGKTTTLKCLTGLLFPTSGQITVLNHIPFERKPEFLKQIAFIMGQKNQLWWDLPAMDTFILNKEIYAVKDKEFKTIIAELSDLLDVKEILKIPVKKLSLGQRMKCEIIASLLHSPRVLFLDEPTIGLDVVMQKKFRDFIDGYNQKFGATVILTSHYMADVEALTKRVIVINHGKLLFDGKLHELIKKYAPEKFIRIVLKEPVARAKLNGFAKIKSYNFPELVLKVTPKNLSETTAKIIQMLPVVDLNIEDVPIEDVIRQIFTKPQ